MHMSGKCMQCDMPRVPRTFRSVRSAISPVDSRTVDRDLLGIVKTSIMHLAERDEISTGRDADFCYSAGV